MNITANSLALRPNVFCLFVLGLLAATAYSSPAQTYSVLYSFCAQPNCADGYYPSGALIQDQSGNIYGTTAFGGSNPACPHGCGTVFKLSPDGTYTVLYSFGGAPDGGGPSGLTFGSDGNLYGTTATGGICCVGYGTVYEVTPSGNETVLYRFCQDFDGNECLDGDVPNGPLIFDPQGNLYGTTIDGGPYECSNGNCGTIFRFAPDGTLTTLYSFTGGSDDGNPAGGLVRDSQGNLYGTDAQYWDLGIYPGTVFRLTPGGVETQIHSFTGNASGGSAGAGLIQDGQGNLYGTTYYGGHMACYDESQSGCGVVFEMSPGKRREHYKYTVLYRFKGRSDGGYPVAPLAQDSLGNLYGTTTYGGNSSCYDYSSYGCGVVFKVSAKGKEVVLHTFSGGSDGGYPYNGLLLDTQGNLYGSANSGGAYGKGVLFKLTQ